MNLWIDELARQQVERLRHDKQFKNQFYIDSQILEIKRYIWERGFSIIKQKSYINELNSNKSLFWIKINTSYWSDEVIDKERIEINIKKIKNKIDILLWESTSYFVCLLKANWKDNIEIEINNIESDIWFNLFIEWLPIEYLKCLIYEKDILLYLNDKQLNIILDIFDQDSVMWVFITFSGIEKYKDICIKFIDKFFSLWDITKPTFKILKEGLVYCGVDWLYDRVLNKVLPLWYVSQEYINNRNNTKKILSKEIT